MSFIHVQRHTTPVGYQDGLELQRVAGTPLATSTEKLGELILLEHKPVFTLGRRTEAAHLLSTESELAQRTGIEVVSVDRGGSITYHCPGQLTAYLLLNLQIWDLPLQRHLEMLEEVAIQTLAHYGITGKRMPSMTGAWVDCPEPRKVCAVGISARRWVTYHGLALNVSPDLSPFAAIIPCGLAGHKVTSLAEILAAKNTPAPTVAEVAGVLTRIVGEIYQAECAG